MGDYSALLPNRMQVVLIGPTGVREVLGIVPVSFDARHVVLQVQQLSAGYGRADIDALVATLESKIVDFTALLGSQAARLASLGEQVAALPGAASPAGGFFAKQFSPLTLQ